MILLNAIRSFLYGWVDPSTPVLPFIPKALKLLLLILFLVQSPSWPFAWHIRVRRYPLKALYELYTKGRKGHLYDLETVTQKRGGVRLVVRNTRMAWADDCDHGLHLSNSDAARMKWCITALAPLFLPKCNVALGASHYVFIREIPFGSIYTMETRLGGWDQKWLYPITEFIIYPRKKLGLSRVKVGPLDQWSGCLASLSSPQSSLNLDSPQTSSTDTATQVKFLKSKRMSATLRPRAIREDGGVVCALAITQYCIKAGRKTVPPRIALHFSMLSEDQDERDHARSIILGSQDFGYGWLQGGWQEEPCATTLGLSIGQDSVEKEMTAEAQWVTNARSGMEKVVEGLSVF